MVPVTIDNATGKVVKSKRGGARPGSGPKNQQRKSSRKMRELLDDGDAQPIEVMMNNMRFYYSRATSFSQQLLDMVDELKNVPEEKRTDEMVAILKMAHQVDEYRDKAQACAVDAAPYCHPRLASLQVKSDNGDSRKPDPNLLEAKPRNAREAMEDWAEFLRTGKPMPAPAT